VRGGHCELKGDFLPPSLQRVAQVLSYAPSDEITSMAEQKWLETSRSASRFPCVTTRIDLDGEPCGDRARTRRIALPFLKVSIRGQNRKVSLICEAKSHGGGGSVKKKCLLWFGLLF
jgi:hypothetical protein